MPDRLSPTVRGDSPTVRGRVIHDRSVYGGGRPLVAGDVAIGAGWGGTATFELAANSRDTLGSITVTASATTPAQATATITVTFAAGAFETAPKPYVLRNGGTGSALITAQASCSTTALLMTASIIPVAGSTYIFDWVLVRDRQPVV